VSFSWRKKKKKRGEGETGDIRAVCGALFRGEEAGRGGEKKRRKPGCAVFGGARGCGVAAFTTLTNKHRMPAR